MNYYEVLGVRQTANPMEILIAYQALSEAHKNSDDPETQVAINVAYGTLINPERRSEHDKEIAIEFPVSAPTQPLVHQVVPQRKIEARTEVKVKDNTIVLSIVWFFGMYLCMSMFFLILIAI